MRRRTPSSSPAKPKRCLRVLPELRAFDREGVAQFLTFGCTLGQRTLFRGVQLLPGASVWSFENGKCQKKKYFSPKTWESQSILPAESFVAEFQETFKRVLPRYFESDSKIGISLTAGLDSRMIMACLPKDGEKPACYTFSGRESRHAGCSTGGTGGKGMRLGTQNSSHRPGFFPRTLHRMLIGRFTSLTVASELWVLMRFT